MAIHISARFQSHRQAPEMSRARNIKMGLLTWKCIFPPRWNLQGILFLMEMWSAVPGVAFTPDYSNHAETWLLPLHFQRMSPLVCLHLWLSLLSSLLSESSDSKNDDRPVRGQTPPIARCVCGTTMLFGLFQRFYGTVNIVYFSLSCPVTPLQHDFNEERVRFMKIATKVRVFNLLVPQQGAATCRFRRMKWLNAVDLQMFVIAVEFETNHYVIMSTEWNHLMVK